MGERGVDLENLLLTLLETKGGSPRERMEPLDEGGKLSKFIANFILQVKNKLLTDKNLYRVPLMFSLILS